MQLASDHPDRIRWNARFAVRPPVFEAHPLAVAALENGFPEGPVLELACGPSGSALALASTGRNVVAVDISDVALAQLAAEAERRNLTAHITCVLADLTHYDAAAERFAMVLATRFWDEVAFRSGCRAVFPGGLVGWEALSGRVGGDVRHERAWYVKHGGLSSRLPAGFEVLLEEAHVSGRHHSTRMLARRNATPDGPGVGRE